MQDDDGQIIGPIRCQPALTIRYWTLHSSLKESRRAEYISITDQEALDAALELTRMEGIIPALESAHALAALAKLSFRKSDNVVVTISGRGDKDMSTYMKYFKLA